MKVSQLLPSVREEVEKPFEEKLSRAKQLVRMFANKNSSISCSFGKDSTVVLWLCLQENKDIPVIFNNTGVQYKETYDFKEQLKESWELNLIETKPVRSYWQVREEIKAKGLVRDDGKKKSDRCCDALKEIPYRKVIKKHGFTHSFTGITAVESRLRMFTACQRGQEYYSKKDGIWKIHPIMFWTPEEVWAFIARVQIPCNPVYEKYGVDRLGCVPCTSHKGWRAQLAKVNPKMYKFISEKYFGQKVFV